MKTDVLYIINVKVECCCYDTRQINSNFGVNPHSTGPPVMPSWGRHELPAIGAICLHVAVPLPSVSSAGSGGEASWQSNKPLLFTQMAGEMAHPTPGNTVPQSWDQHEHCSSAPWMKGQTGSAVSSSQFHSPHRVGHDWLRGDWDTVGFHVICFPFFVCVCVCVPWYEENTEYSMFLKWHTLIAE